jgi:mannose-6-phosphate isomerase-like protein (cupin superfamily)
LHGRLFCMPSWLRLPLVVFFLNCFPSKLLNFVNIMESGTLIRKNSAKIVNLGSKVIRKYAAPDRQLEINYMTLKGRTPEKDGTFLCETKVHFMVLVVKGKGKIFCGGSSYDVEEGDSVDIPAGTLFAAEGNFEYITAESPNRDIGAGTSPAWYKEQARIVDGKGKEVLREKV